MRIPVPPMERPVGRLGLIVYISTMGHNTLCTHVCVIQYSYMIEYHFLRARRVFTLWMRVIGHFWISKNIMVWFWPFDLPGKSTLSKNMLSTGWYNDYQPTCTCVCEYWWRLYSGQLQVLYICMGISKTHFCGVIKSVQISIFLS